MSYYINGIIEIMAMLVLCTIGTVIHRVELWLDERGAYKKRA